MPTERHSHRHFFTLLFSAGLAALLAGCTPENGGGTGNTPFAIFEPKPPEPPAPNPNAVWPPRAVWVVRQAYRSPDEIAQLMENVRQTGLNTVLFQVRGNATAFYRSSIEPLAYEYRSGDPGFDPLEVACREAHRRGLALHAWVNVMPGWRGTSPPSDPRQLFNAHPDWFWYDQNGRRQPLQGFYVSVNPCRPDVRSYLVGVFREIVTKYPVDGLHLDYIRFPNEETPRGSDYPYDVETLTLYRQQTGRRPQDSKSMWAGWRTQQVTQLVREIRQMTSQAGRTVRLTASCGVAFEQWKPTRFQDGPTWLRERLVDAVFVMNYTKDTRSFIQRQEAWHRAAPGAWIAPGISLGEPKAPIPPAATLEQLKLAARWGHGFSIFSASGLYAPSGQSRLNAIRQFIFSMQPPRLTDALLKIDSDQSVREVFGS